MVLFFSSLNAGMSDCCYLEVTARVQCNDNLILTLYSLMLISYLPLYHPNFFCGHLRPFLKTEPFYLIKTCEINWNVAFYILNTITVYEKIL